MLICTNPACSFTAQNGPIADTSTFCPSCGTRLTSALVQQPLNQPYSQPRPGVQGPVAGSAPQSTRFLAGLIDVGISLLMVLFAFIPIINILAALADTAFWLLRDIKGASPGKKIMGLEVRTLDGGIPTSGALIIRNLPFAPLLIQIIPIVGNVILPFVGVIMLVECILVLVSDRRLGDMMAGTRVMLKSAQSPSAYSASA